MWRSKRSLEAFALYEVLLGLAIFAVGVLALGRSVQNCLNASALSSEDNRVRQILADRMAEIQATPGSPDANKETKVATGYGDILLVQKSAPAGLKVQNNNTELNGINLISLSAVWKRGGVSQTRKIQFYVYRNG
jgi:Tfp pilus assembly protein PilV